MIEPILVTGACGYIGRHVVSALIKEGVEVIASDLVKRGAPDGVKFIEGDIIHDASLCEVLPNLTACVHLAWQDGFRHNAPSHLANLSAHVDFLQKLAERGTKRLAVMGSMHEVGYWEGAITGESPCNPMSMYGIAKNALRQALRVVLKDSQTKLQWIRGYYIYGDDRCNHSIFTKLLEAASAGKKTFPFTSGRNKYDFIQVDQLAEMIAAVVLQDEVDGIINCCTGNPKSLAEAVEGFIAANELDIKLDYGAFPDRPYDSPGVWGDPTVINLILAKKEGQHS